MNWPTVDQIIRAYCMRAVESLGSKSQAAKVLGVSIRTFHRFFARWEVERRDRPRDGDDIAEEFFKPLPISRPRINRVATWLELEAENLRNAKGDGDILASNLDGYADEIREALRDD